MDDKNWLYLARGLHKTFPQFGHFWGFSRENAQFLRRCYVMLQRTRNKFLAIFRKLKRLSFRSLASDLVLNTIFRCKLSSKNRGFSQKCEKISRDLWRHSHVTWQVLYVLKHFFTSSKGLWFKRVVKHGSIF